ncbi:neutral/alkaline non-lysosomal ceramidase N-terminal domain-containing protein [Paenibacillus spongiae]|uniref:Neutral/alkaline non-lysosomal ceramidase N-terminal domain-containing protein n=1 Tax=Paenibacillus spongiae TaxID=2909671 RepID=A0ABY5SDF9_9BACL|nr:neutral/alkaline non-lysosomal ceramidase N-terminal domain-containing protein [Paenibacillus spongiae]UVI31991.1 neutral/alkaline non-lysosomal ceramidase N-terminal domain-containing protein [Paenibacillus spongiae]
MNGAEKGKATGLKLGSAKIDITPEEPIPLCGFASRKHDGYFKEVRQRLYARILFLCSRDEDGSERTAVIVSADLVWWGSDRMPAVKARLLNEWGIEPSAVLFHGTHTHCGPQTSGLFVPSLGEMDAKYMEMLENRILEGVAQAAANVEAVIAERGEGSCGIGVNRRSIVEGQVRMTPNEEGPADPAVTVIRFSRPGGSAKAVMVHYTCHPTTTADNAVSSEFPGIAMEEVERELGGDAVSLYLQGFCGDVGPIADTDMHRMASALSGEVMQVLRHKMSLAQPAEWSSAIGTAELPLQPLPEERELAERTGETDVFGEWSRLLLAHPEYLKPSLTLEGTLITIADGISLLAMNAEMVIEYGLYIKRQSGGKVLPVAYSNGMIGYVTTAEQLSQGGYEPYDSTFYFAMPAPLDVSAEARVTELIDALLHIRR